MQRFTIKCTRKTAWVLLKDSHAALAILLLQPAHRHGLVPAGIFLVPRAPAPASGVANWSKIGFVVDFRNLLFGCDFDLSFSKDYSLMEIFNYEVDFTAKCDT